MAPPCNGARHRPFHRLPGASILVALSHPREYDFVGGQLAAALLEFRYLDELPAVAGPSVRSLIITDPFFGALVFFGVLIETRVVEIAEFEDDPDYWSIVDLGAVPITAVDEIGDRVHHCLAPAASQGSG